MQDMKSMHYLGMPLGYLLVQSNDGASGAKSESHS